ncbi:hypothetical protein [Undibacterium sp. WLHG33]
MANLFGQTVGSSVSDTAIHDGSALLSLHASYYSTHAKSIRNKKSD